MPNYRYISPAEKELHCRLSLTLKNHEIAYHTGIGIRTVQHIIKLWRQTGGVNRKPLNGGRPRVLTGYHISVYL
jgi:transposase